MKRRSISLVLGALALGGSGPQPAALAGVETGMWEVSRDATGRGARRGCIDDMVLIATYAHAGQRCVRTILADRPRELLLSLDCGQGDFGRSRMTVTTPRSLKLETQGFRGGEPYDFVVYARRVGECPAPALR